MYKSCTVCGKEDPNSENEILKPYGGHDWVEDGDGYSCSRCGLENANGADGSVIMEDLSEEYGNGENYIVGYYVKNNVQFGTYIALVVPGQEDEVIISDGSIEISEMDGVRAYAFSKAEVEAWAESNGYTDYAVKFVFVPEGSDGSFDYAITF